MNEAPTIATRGTPRWLAACSSFCSQPASGPLGWLAVGGTAGTRGTGRMGGRAARGMVKVTA